jgi:hypothetical protein
VITITLPKGVAIGVEDSALLRHEVDAGRFLAGFFDQVDGLVRAGMIAGRTDDHVAGLGRHKPDALLVQQVPDLFARVIVLIVIVRGADRQAGLQMGEEFFSGEAVIGTVMR